MNRHEQHATDLARLRAAIEVLLGAGAVKQRLRDAYVLHLQDIEPAALPRDAAESLRALSGALSTATAAGSLGAVEATIRKMSDVEAGGCALRILDLYLTLCTGRGADSNAGQQRQLRLVGDE
jgi:hypothetical protein